jgi:hypothetical protein
MSVMHTITPLDVLAALAAVGLYVYLLYEHFAVRREAPGSRRSLRVYALPFIITAAVLLSSNVIPAPVIVGLAIWSLGKDQPKSDQTAPDSRG